MELLEVVTTYIQKQDTVLRDSIPLIQRLSCTLRYLATVSSFEELKFATAIALQISGVLVKVSSVH